MQNRRTHYFEQGHVVTWLLTTGEYGAQTVDGNPTHGIGHTRFAAIADLNEAIGTDEPDQVDHQAARFDHAQDLRKNWEPAE